MLLYRIIILLLLTTSLYSQKLYFQVGERFYHTQVQVPIFGDENNYTNDYAVYNILFEYPLNEKWSTAVSYTSFGGWTTINFDGDFQVGIGASVMLLDRLGFLLEYDVLHKSSRLKLLPFFKIEMEYARAQDGGGDGVGVQTVVQGIEMLGLDYFKPKPRFQPAPALGFHFEWNPFWKIWLRGTFQRTFGYIPYQKHYVDYTLDGVKQPTAEYSANGTDNIFSIGLGYELWTSKRQKGIAGDNNGKKAKKRKKRRRRR